MAEKKRVRMDDHDAREYPFTFNKYAQVIMNNDGQDGTIVDGVWEGEASDVPFYTITYTVKSNADGSLREMSLTELRDLNPKRKST
jgi:hypothetical protein